MSAGSGGNLFNGVGDGSGVVVQQLIKSCRCALNKLHALIRIIQLCPQQFGELDCQNVRIRMTSRCLRQLDLRSHTRRNPGDPSELVGIQCALHADVVVDGRLQNIDLLMASQKFDAAFYIVLLDRLECRNNLFERLTEFQRLLGQRPDHLFSDGMAIRQAIPQILYSAQHVKPVQRINIEKQRHITQRKLLIDERRTDHGAGRDCSVPSGRRTAADDAPAIAVADFSLRPADIVSRTEQAAADAN